MRYSLRKTAIFFPVRCSVMLNNLNFKLTSDWMLFQGDSSICTLQ